MLREYYTTKPQAQLIDWSLMLVLHEREEIFWQWGGSLQANRQAQAALQGQSSQLSGKNIVAW